MESDELNVLLGQSTKTEPKDIVRNIFIIINLYVPVCRVVNYTMAQDYCKWRML